MYFIGNRPCQLAEDQHLVRNFSKAKELAQSLNGTVKVYECIDVTDLALNQEDKSKYDVHTFIRYGAIGVDNPERFGNIDYARWVMNQYDVPAGLLSSTEKYANKHKLYCTYNNKRYKYVGHSRLGDVWITSDFKSYGYELRVSILDLTNFSKEI